MTTGYGHSYPQLFLYFNFVPCVFVQPIVFFSFVCMIPMFLFLVYSGFCTQLVHVRPGEKLPVVLEHQEHDIEEVRWSVQGYLPRNLREGIQVEVRGCWNMVRWVSF